MAVVRKTRRIRHKGKVHDLCVNNTHTYNAEGLGVHNSAAGSLVSYCLRITDIDPIKYGLLFERFLDWSRADPPDIDMDFDPRARDWVKEHIIETFGANQTCSIGTYQTYKTRAVILDCARALGLDVHEAMSVTKMLEGSFDVETDAGIDEQPVDKMSFEQLQEQFPELKAYFDENPEVLHHAIVLRNQVKNLGKHAGGMIISNLDLQDRIPVFRDKSGSIVSSWSEGLSDAELSKVGLVKFDILGLNNLSIISDCIAYIEQTQGYRIARDTIPIDDAEAIRLGSHDEMLGIFQFENPGTKPVADAVGMDSLDDISAVTSLIRPGPKDMGMHTEYAERKHGKDYEMPEFLRELLKKTYGVMVYQEQILKIAQVLAGFTPIESGVLRKVVSKKKLEDLDEQRTKFLAGAQTRVADGDITQVEVESVWDMLESFGGYGFNLAHAASYSALTAVEFWLRLHYPIEYVTALLNNTAQHKKRHGSDNILIDYISYARNRGTKILPPCVKKSGSDYRIENGQIRFALKHVKSVGASAELIETGQPYDSFEDFYERINRRKCNKRVVNNLIAAGVFECFGTRDEVQSLYYKLRAVKKDVLPEYTDDEWVEHEVDVMGICLSRPPLVMQYKKTIENSKFQKIRDMSGERQTGMVFGRIGKIVARNSKKGSPMYVVTMNDGINTINYFVFKGAMQWFRKNIKTGYIVAMPLRKFDDGGACFVDGPRVDKTVILKK